MMRKKRVWLILIGVVVLTVTLVAVFGPEREPSYRGKKLSYWVDHYDRELERPPHTDPRATFVEQNEDAADAVRELGTNALPYLLKWMTYEPSALGLRFERAIRPILPSSSLAWLPLPYTRQCRADNAFAVIAAMERRAEVAIPDLTKIATNGHSRSASRAVYLIHMIRKIAPAAIDTNSVRPVVAE